MLDGQTIRPVLDDKLILMKQCVRDVVHMLRKLGKDDDLSENSAMVAALVTTLFAERCRTPLTQERVKTLMLGAELASADIEDLKLKQEEFNEIVRRVERERKTLQRLREKTAGAKAELFLRRTIGSANYGKLKNDGKFTFLGSNGSKYTIDSDGNIEKHGVIRGWTGNLSTNDEKGEMDDGIATAYVHIIANARKFDRDKGCGEITVET